MTNEEKDLLIAYLVDTGDIDPDGDVEAQFLEWYQVRDQVVSGEAHYKAVLEAAGYGSGATPVATGPAVASVGMNGPRPLGPPPGPHPTCSLSAKTNRSATTTRPAAATSKVTLPAALAVWQCLARGRLGSRT